MKNFLKRSDLNVLLNMFIPGEYVLTIHDPDHVLVQNESNVFMHALNTDKNVYKVLANFSSIDFPIVDDYDFILDFSGIEITDIKSKDYHFINNPDKTIRWVYPADLKKATFLNFYNTSGFRANVLSFLFKAAFALKLKKAIRSGSFRIYYNDSLKIESVLKHIPHDNYSVFTGTVGPNRKFVVEINSNGVSTHFAKWAISNTSQKLVSNELTNITKIKHIGLHYMQIPTHTATVDDSIFVYESIKPSQKIRSSNELTDIHFKALSELYEKTVTYNLSGITTFREHLIATIYSLKPDARIAGSENMIELLRKSLNVLDFDSPVPCSQAHFDFTPWNMYVTSEKLYVYDWELSDKMAPILFDVFHYIFQKNILIDRTDLRKIKEEMLSAVEHPILKDIINRYNINIELCYKAYLLYTISYYLKIYGQQKELHQQVRWLINVWYKALEEIVIKKSAGSHRKNFIDNLFMFLNKYQYALMKFSERSIAELKDTSDLDLLINKNDLHSILDYLKETGSVKKAHVVKKSFMTTVGLFFADGSFLSIDLLYAFKRKTKTILSASTILNESATTYQGIKVPQKHYDFEYMLVFYQLNGSDIPAKYISYFNSLPIQDRASILTYLRKKYELAAYLAEELFTYSDTIRYRIMKVVRSKFENKGICYFNSVLNYLKDTFTDMITNKGLIITVSGVDGAGKSTIIEDLKESLKNKFRRKVIVLRHRPSVLPILSAWRHGKKKAELMAAERLPRQGTNGSSLSSLLRFSYYYTDYLFGQIYVYLRYVLRGYVVIYDRYYFDFIGDSKRSNLKINAKLVTWLYAFIYKPKLNVLLYASPELILKRKLELSEDDIKTLTSDYLFLFDKLSLSNKSSKYISINNIKRDDTLDIIIEEYINAHK